MERQRRIRSVNSPATPSPRFREGGPLSFLNEDANSMDNNSSANAPSVYNPATPSPRFREGGSLSFLNEDEDPLANARSVLNSPTYSPANFFHSEAIRNRRASPPARKRRHYGGIQEILDNNENSMDNNSSANVYSISSSPTYSSANVFHSNARTNRTASPPARKRRYYVGIQEILDNNENSMDNNPSANAYSVSSAPTYSSAIIFHSEARTNRTASPPARKRRYYVGIQEILDDNENSMDNNTSANAHSVSNSPTLVLNQDQNPSIPLERNYGWLSSKNFTSSDV